MQCFSSAIPAPKQFHTTWDSASASAADAGATVWKCSCIIYAAAYATAVWTVSFTTAAAAPTAATDSIPAAYATAVWTAAAAAAAATAGATSVLSAAATAILWAYDGSATAEFP